MIRFLLAIISIILLPSAIYAQSLDRNARAVDFVYESGAKKSIAATTARTIGFPGFGRHYAVVVGISRFGDSSLNVLPGADDDALRMYDYLIEEAGFDRVWLITNEKASRDRIAQIIQDELSPKITSSDRVLFYYTGHGVMKNHGGRQLGYLPLSYSSVKSPSTMISMQTLKQWSESLFGARQVLFILDSCVSGLAGDIMMSEIDPTLQRSFSERGHHLISAGTGDQQGYATASGSYFTQALLDGLRGQADFIIGGRRDNAITVSELMVYLRDRLRRELLLSKGERYAMTPQMTVLNDAILGEFFFPAPIVKDEESIGGKIIQTGPVKSELILPDDLDNNLSVITNNNDGNDGVFINKEGENIEDIRRRMRLACDRYIKAGHYSEARWNYLGPSITIHEKSWPQNDRIDGYIPPIRDDSNNRDFSFYHPVKETKVFVLKEYGAGIGREMGTEESKKTLSLVCIISNHNDKYILGFADQRFIRWM